MVSLSRFLSGYLLRQLNNFFPDNVAINEVELEKIVNSSLESLKFCFQHIKISYFRGEFEKTFNYLNGDHYSMFLYKVSHLAYTDLANVNLAEKVFQLNRALHAIDAYYKVKMPEVFLFCHPLGTVLGSAHYGNFFCVHQNCTIGSRVEGIYPTFSDKTIMYSSSYVIGDCKVGSNVIFGSGSTVIDLDVPSDTLVLERSPNNKFKPTNNSYFEYIFGD